MAKCDYCGEEVSLPYTCGYCGGSFCPRHRLPENHECEGLEKIDEESEEEGRIYRGVSDDLEIDEEEVEEPDITFDMDRDFDVERKFDEDRERDRGGTSEMLGGLLSMMKSMIFSRVTTILILIMFLAFIGQHIASLIFGSEYILFVAASPETILKMPWTVFTSIFVHATQPEYSFHLFINALILLFIGLPLENSIGKRKFIELFLVSGAVASVGQVLVIMGTGSPGIVYGASGAIMGVLGALTALAPRLPVLLFFFIPMKLWMVTVGYGVYEIILALTGFQPGIAHIAHLVGLGVGLIYGYRFRKEMEEQRGGSYTIHVSRY